MAVYVIGPKIGPKKIGMANNPSARRREIQVGNPKLVSVLHSIESPPDLSSLIENMAHKLLRDKRLCGEWFNVTTEEAVKAINDAIVAVNNGERAKKARSYDRFVDEMVARFLPGTFALLAEVLEPGEDRTDFVRMAVAREIARRSKPKGRERAKKKE